jgi:hypothetical protein
MVARIGQGFDVVIASRFQPGSQEIGVPAYRKFLSHLSSAGIRMLVRYPGARDYTCGFRVYRAETLRRLIDLFESAGAAAVQACIRGDQRLGYYLAGLRVSADRGTLPLLN